MSAAPAVAPSGKATGAAYVVGDLTLKELQDAGGRPVPTDNGRAQWVSVPPPIVCYDAEGWRISDPPGEATDLGSIPQIAWSFGFSPDGEGVEGFKVHDDLYRTSGTLVFAGVCYRERPQPYTRAEADAILRDLLAQAGVGLIRRNLIYAAVRLGGAKGWGN